VWSEGGGRAVLYTYWVPSTFIAEKPFSYIKREKGRREGGGRAKRKVYKNLEGATVVLPHLDPALLEKSEGIGVKYEQQETVPPGKYRKGRQSLVKSKRNQTHACTILIGGQEGGVDITPIRFGRVNRRFRYTRGFRNPKSRQRGPKRKSY